MNKITDHARARFRQRGINEMVIDYLMHYGDEKHAPGGATKVFLTKRNAAKMISTLKKEINKIERARGLIIVKKDGSILTGYHRN